MKQNLAVTANGEITFYAWMMCRYLGQPTPISDIAFDMAFDENWPLDNKYTSIRNHLGTNDDRLMELFERCWKEYRQTVKFLKELKKSK